MDFKSLNPFQKRKYWNEVNNHISACLTKCDSFISEKIREDVKEYLYHNELGLAAETLADIAIEEDWSLPNETKEEILQIFEIMGYRDRKSEVFEIYERAFKKS